MPLSCPSPSMQDAVMGALFGMCIGDALSMPVHWYYDVRRLKADFPNGISGYEAPKKSFPGSIMNLSNTGGAGRGTDKGSIIGDVICHGKKEYWMRGGQYHYHHGMSPGQNTLDTLVAVQLVESIVGSRGQLDLDAFVDRYIQFMTTPGTHNDTYAASAHRMFFENLVHRQRDKHDCADNDHHNIDAVCGIINVVPVSLLSIMARTAGKEVQCVWNGQTVGGLGADPSKAITQTIRVTRNSNKLPTYGALLHTLLTSLVGLEERSPEHFRAAVAAAGEQIGLPRRDFDAFAKTSAREDPMVACYIDSNFQSLLLLAYKYGPQGLAPTLLAGANTGGENVNRNAVLGAVVGAYYGFDHIAKAHPELVKGLHNSQSYAALFGSFSNVLS